MLTVRHVITPEINDTMRLLSPVENTCAILSVLPNVIYALSIKQRRMARSLRRHQKCQQVRLVKISSISVAWKVLNHVLFLESIKFTDEDDENFTVKLLNTFPCLFIVSWFFAMSIYIY